MSVHARRLLFVAMLAAGCHDRAAEKANVVPRAAEPAPAPVVSGGIPAPSMGPSDGAPLLVQGPFLVDGMPYTVEMERYVNAPDTAVRRIRVKDSAQRVVYEEDVGAMLHGDSLSWIEVSVRSLEDAAGRSRGLELDYGFYPSAPNSGEDFMIVVPRGNALRPITPLVSYLGNREPLLSGAQPLSRRLQPGNRMVVRPWMYNYEAIVPLRVDLGCEPGSPACIVPTLRDSIAGLARFAVEARPHPIDSAATIELFAAPGAASTEHIQLVAGSTIEVLGGAGRVSFDRTRGMDLVVTDDWLFIRAGNRTGWVHGAETYGALGLPSAG